MSDNEHENIPNTDPAGDAEASKDTPAKLDHWSPVTEAMRTHGDPRFTKRGNPIDPADPGTGLSRVLAVLATILVVAFVVLWQNTPDPTKQAIFYGQTTPEEAAAPEPDQPAPGNFGQVDLMGRIFLRGLDMFKSQNMMSQIEAPGMVFIDEDRVRLIMISAELESTDAALSRLEAFRLEELGFEEEEDPEQISVSTNDLVLQELDILRTLYTQGADELSADQRQQLKDRYGYIGHVALTHGKPSTDPTREALTNGFMTLMLFLALVGLVLVLGPLAGLVLLIFGIISFSTGRMKMRMRVPLPGGSIYLETYALFVFGFCIMAVSTFLISNSAYPELAAFSLIAQWLLLLTVFWGLIRGANLREWRLASGWHTGEGVFKEIGCGIIAYLASIPIYIIGVIITAILLVTKEMLATRANGGVPPEPEPLVNPVFEMIASGDIFIILFLFVLATTWAPIVEESIFRGTLYRHLRGRLHWVPTAILTGILFAFMHDYGPLMVAPLIALGFMFAFMREWRGSIIAPMVAHFIHNFTLMSFMIIFVQLIKDPAG
jgi:membrane protease YdiL (CAAX protease family)